MVTVGIVSKNKNVKFVKELNKKYNIQAINIRQKDDLKDKHVDILVLEDLVISKELVEKILKHVRYLLIQDNIYDIQFKLEEEINIITFGFNHKSTVTVSSVTEENIVICIQRTMKSINGKEIHPEEIIIENKKQYNINKYIIKKIIREILEK